MRGLKAMGMAVAVGMFCSTGALAWCEADCVGLCKATSKGGAAACIAKYQCSQYAGKVCEPERRAARARAINSGGGGGGFSGCLARGVRAGWGSAETASYCRGRS